MSCGSLSRAFPEDGPLRRSVRFSSECRASNHREPSQPGSLSLSTLATAMTSDSMMSQSAPAPSVFDNDDIPLPPPACRFPKLEECAHFHYERVSLGGISIEVIEGNGEDMMCSNDGSESPDDEGWICLKVRTHVNSSTTDDVTDSRNLTVSWTEASDVREWNLTRNAQNFMQLDDMLHRCIYDRKVSGLANLSEEITASLIQDRESYVRLIGHYVHHLSIIADDAINCGPTLNWLQTDNRGHKLLVANEDSSSINTPAVAAAYSVRKYVSQARDEISFEVGDMISIIDMPGPQESVWWRGKRGFRVGFFPRHCVAVIGDKVPRHMTQPPPIVGSVAVVPIKPVLRKHGKLISLFRSFILSRPSRRSLKQQGILRERVFGCDLGEHLLNAGRDVPLVLAQCARALESRGPVDGLYRLSGGAGLVARLRAEFDAGQAPDLTPANTDPHALASLLKMYFRELPNPLCTYQLYDSFVSAVQAAPEHLRLRRMRECVVKLPPPHYRTLSYLMRHLHRVSSLGASTGMTARNMAIVWAPNLLRSPAPRHELARVAHQAVVTEFLICYAEELFSQEQGADSANESSVDDERNDESILELRPQDSTRRPKSLPINPPTKLLSLEEARYRNKCPSPVTAATPRADVTNILRPTTNHAHKYIEVGSGPNNLPQYHTVLDLPISGTKRGLKRSPSGWRMLFSRSKLQRQRPSPPTITVEPANNSTHIQDSPMPVLRPVKSCESLQSENDTLPPLTAISAPLKHHTRSASCDSYFEPWQSELAEMRLRLSPQERDGHMFSEEDDKIDNVELQAASLPSSPELSDLCSSRSSPKRCLKVDVHAHKDHADRPSNILEEQLSQIKYIDAEESPRGKCAAEKRTSARTVTETAKRLCKDRDSPVASMTDFQTSLINVKLRERSSPRKTKSQTRYSGVHHPVTNDDKIHNRNVTINSRLSWHGKDGHSTLIKIDWPIENTSISNLTNSTRNSTPITPHYDPLESDSENSDNKQTIKVTQCDEKCTDKEKCLKCELNATDYEAKADFKVGLPVTRVVSNENVSLHDSLDVSPVKSDVSYQNLNRLSVVSTSSNSDAKIDKVMTTSHDSSSGYSNISKNDDPYECYTFKRPNYINLNSSDTSKSSPGSPLKSPLKSTISITFRSPTKVKKSFESDTPIIDRESVYEDIDLDQNLSIVEDASVPERDACLPTQQASQPDFNQDLIILETPVEERDIDVYSQVKFFKKSIDEVNALIVESEPNVRHYENVTFGPIKDKSSNDYENINVETLKITEDANKACIDNGNVVKTQNVNVRELANRFESPTEQKQPFNFEKQKIDVKYSTLDKDTVKKADLTLKLSPKPFSLTKNAINARSLDENAFVQEFSETERRKSLETENEVTNEPDLNLNMEPITPTTENKISLIQRDDKPNIKNLIGFDADKNLSRERIEKYKEERRNFLREKYSSQSFRSNPDTLTRIKVKKEIIDCDVKEDVPKFERRNTVDLGQRMRFSVAKSVTDLDDIQSPTDDRVFEDVACQSVAEDRNERKEKVSPTYNIRDMAAMFEQKSQNSG